MLIKDQGRRSCTPAPYLLRRYCCCCSWLFHLLLSRLFHAAVLEIFEVNIWDDLQEHGKKESCPCAMQNRPGFASGKVQMRGPKGQKIKWRLRGSNFVTSLAPQKNPGLDRPAVVFFQIQDSQKSIVLQFLCVSFSLLFTHVDMQRFCSCFFNYIL